MTHQILSMCQHFKDLNQTFVISRRVEQFRQRVQQRVVTTVEDSVLHTEMENLESLLVILSRHSLPLVSV